MRMFMAALMFHLYRLEMSDQIGDSMRVLSLPEAQRTRGPGPGRGMGGRSRWTETCPHRPGLREGPLRVNGVHSGDSVGMCKSQPEQVAFSAIPSASTLGGAVHSDLPIMPRGKHTVK